MNGASRINIRELLSNYKYYNIAVILMAFEGQTEHALHFFGEKNTFRTMRDTMEYSNFIRNVDFSTYPISIDRKGCVIGPHYQIASAILAGKDEIFYMSPDVPGEYFDESCKSSDDHDCCV